MKPVMFRRAVPLILGVLFLAAASAWAADPKRNLAVAPGTPAAATETRVALVIGNSNYKSAPLRNPVNDAKAIADKLQGLGFKVTLKLDQDQKSMAEAIRVFGNQLKDRRRRAVLLRRPRHAGEGPQLPDPGGRRHPERRRSAVPQRGRERSACPRWKRPRTA